MQKNIKNLAKRKTLVKRDILFDISLLTSFILQKKYFLHHQSLRRYLDRLNQI